MDDKDKRHVLVRALPPQTDYLTYLTILEYNLHKEDLPLFHKLLQDEKLVTNIGWDLIHILLPLLPDSADCLQDVATCGNPREVVLKVTEELETLGAQLKTSTLDAEDDEDEEETEAKSDLDDDNGISPESVSGGTTASPEQLSQFQTLIHMLCILHPRIQTKKPSNFLENSIRSILIAYQGMARSPEATRAVLMFLKSQSGSRRPAPPPRNQEPQIPSVAEHNAAPDPEGQDEVREASEAKIAQEMLQALVTHLVELHFDALSMAGTWPPLAWTERFAEKKFSERVVPFRQTATTQFKEVEELRLRDVLVNQIVMVATSDLKLDWKELLGIVDAADSDEPGSAKGALYLLAALASRSLGRSQTADFQMAIMPHHDRISTAILGDPTTAMTTDVSAVTVDALLVMGWLAFTTGGFHSDANTEYDELFHKYLQKFSALAATQELPSVRGQTHLFMSTLLHSHRSIVARSEFIKDTIRFCPFPNLREAAVGWLKTEIVDASKESESENNVLAQLDLMEFLAEEIFVFDASEMDFFAHAAFYQADLNLFVLICSSPVLSKRLNVLAKVTEHSIDKYFMDTLSSYAESYRKDLPNLESIQIESILELDLLDTNIQLAREALNRLQQSHSET